VEEILDRSLSTCCSNEIVQNYSIVIHEDLESGYWAEVPALPGCYSQAETMPELLSNVREAISGVLEVITGPEMVRLL